MQEIIIIINNLNNEKGALTSQMIPGHAIQLFNKLCFGTSIGYLLNLLLSFNQSSFLTITDSQIKYNQVPHHFFKNSVFKQRKERRHSEKWALLIGFIDK